MGRDLHLPSIIMVINAAAPKNALSFREFVTESRHETRFHRRRLGKPLATTRTESRQNSPTEQRRSVGSIKLRTKADSLLQ